MKLGFICLNVPEIEAVGMASVSTAAATATHPSEIPHCPRLHPIALGENETSEMVRQHFLENYSPFYSQFRGAYHGAVWAYS